MFTIYSRNIAVQYFKTKNVGSWVSPVVKAPLGAILVRHMGWQFDTYPRSRQREPTEKKTPFSKTKKRKKEKSNHLIGRKAKIKI